MFYGVLAAAPQLLQIISESTISADKSNIGKMIVMKQKLQCLLHHLQPPNKTNQLTSKKVNHVINETVSPAVLQTKATNPPSPRLQMSWIWKLEKKNNKKIKTKQKNNYALKSLFTCHK